MISQLPPTRRLPTARRYAARRQLELYLSRPRWRRRPLVLGVVIAILVGGSAGAVGLLRSAHVTNRQSARCYVVPELGQGESFNGTTVGAPGRPGSKVQADHAIEACQALWRGGFFVPGKYGIQRPDKTKVTVRPVPPLIACILPDGRAAIFPGDATTCGKLGLPLVSR
jgi:hypothetical protein